jgi:hypothetical protein
MYLKYIFIIGVFAPMSQNIMSKAGHTICVQEPLKSLKNMLLNATPSDLAWIINRSVRSALDFELYSVQGVQLLVWVLDVGVAGTLKDKLVEAGQVVGVRL